MLLIVWKNYGQLGNRLITFSSLVALAIDRNLTIYNPSFGQYSQYFEYFEGQKYPFFKKRQGEKKYRQNLIPDFAWPLLLHFLQKRKFIDILRLSKVLFESDDLVKILDDDVDAIMALNNKKFLVWTAWNLDFVQLKEKHKSELIEIFRPNKSISTFVRETFNEIDAKKFLIGVHIRRGDYRSYCDGKYFFSFDNYKVLLVRLLNYYGVDNVQFVIASNESVPPDFCTNLPALVLNGSTMQDLYCLARCNLIVGPPSTFGDWASFYGSTLRLVYTGVLPADSDLSSLC